MSEGGTRTALFLTPEAPYPLVGGGQLRAACLLEYLAQSYAVDVIVFREPGAADPRLAFPPGLVRWIDVVDLPFHSKGVAARVWRNGVRLIRRAPPLVDRFAGAGAQVSGILGGRRYDVAVVEHFWCAPYHEQLVECAEHTVLDLVDVESVLHERCRKSEPWPASFAHAVFAKATRRLEHVWLPRYSRLLATSREDAEAVCRIVSHPGITVYPNTLPAALRPNVPEEEAIAFSGNLEYRPNISAVRYFAREVWPLVRRPKLEWRLIGRNDYAVRRLVSGDPSIRCTGPVEDAIQELARAQVVVVPVLAGSGTRLKIVEAWAAGRAVVSTAIGAEGLPAKDGENILLADGAGAFAAAVSRLLDAPELRRAVGAAGRETYERELTWQSAWQRLREAGL
ncbi:MAG: glycosyltransferase [Bryobacteraceae bacterium]